VALTALLKRTIDTDHYRLSPRIGTLQGILAKLEPKPVPAPLPPPKECPATRRARNRDRNFTRAKVERRRAQLEQSVARYLSQ